MCVNFANVIEMQSWGKDSYVEVVKVMQSIVDVAVTLLLRPTWRLSCVADSHHLDTKANKFVTSTTSQISPKCEATPTTTWW